MTGDGKTGTITGMDGIAEIALNDGTYILTVSYIGYTTVSVEVEIRNGGAYGICPEDAPGGSGILEIRLHTDSTVLENATVTARKNFGSIASLQNERKMSSHAIENIGAKEMGIKGISNAQEGVAKISGISVADAGQMIVRGLGDRYSTTTLNGLPIASPNPDCKLIPLDIFPTSAIRNITVSKVYETSSFADYSGAHVDISTGKADGGDMLSLSFSTGGIFGTVFSDFLEMDRKSLFVTPGMKREVGKSSYADFTEYARYNPLFDTGFQIKTGKALPDLDGGFGLKKSWRFGENGLSVLASASIRSGNETVRRGWYRTYEASSEGMVGTECSYDSYGSRLDMTALLDIESSILTDHSIGLTYFFARNAKSDYSRRDIIDHLETYDLVGSTSVSHFYAMHDIQLTGRHDLSGGRWELDWSGSVCLTSSDEPDRRQVMFSRGDDGSLGFFNLNQQETQRYFSGLSELETALQASAVRSFSDLCRLRFGASFRDKSRDFGTTRFYYNMKKIADRFDAGDIWNMDPYLNDANIESGLVGIDRKQHRRDSYKAANTIGAAFLDTDLNFAERWFINAGLRFEASEQSVDYNDDVEDRHRSLKAFDFFPAVNVKFAASGRAALRLALSRTITRPSFIEMAPFLYQESFGGTQLRGNENLRNGYNWNVDLRYEFLGQRDMFAVTGYFKYLDTPVERTQRLSGGALEQTFQNADKGLAAGVEAEFRTEPVRHLTFSGNASYIFTNVKLPESGAYTNRERSLQGASPYIVNADVSYTPVFGNGSRMSLSLLYNVQGPRIHAVGILGLGDERQMPFHSLDFSGSYSPDGHLSVSLNLRNLLGSSVRFTQDIPNAGRTIEVEGWKVGTGMTIGVSYSF